MKKIGFLIFGLLAANPVFGKERGPCRNWSPAFKIGDLDHTIINESSGISTSAVDSDRLFHVNDSEGGPQVHITDLEGTFNQTVVIQGFNPIDVEDLGYGKCRGKNCLVIADIGDNYLKRDFLELVFLEDKPKFGSHAIPLGKIKYNYPDGRHDAEGLAMHPNGDIYILTKDVNYKERKVNPAKLYVIKHQQWKDFPSKVIEASKVLSIDLNYLLYEDGFWGRMVTGLDISPDGSTVLILTYENAIEIFTDLSKEIIKTTRSLKQNQDFKIVKLQKLPQQESIAYSRDTKSKTLFYTTSYHGATVPLMSLSCRNFFE